MLKMVCYFFFIIRCVPIMHIIKLNLYWIFAKLVASDKYSKICQVYLCTKFYLIAISRCHIFAKIKYVLWCKLTYFRLFIIRTVLKFNLSFSYQLFESDTFFVILIASYIAEKFNSAGQKDKKELGEGGTVEGSLDESLINLTGLWHLAWF